MKKIITSMFSLIILSTFAYSRDDAVCESGNCINGKGTATFLSGERYTGQWKNEKRHGKGRSIIDGEFPMVYDGYWKDDKKHGKGSFKKAPIYYTGEWKEDQMDGKGTYEHFDGTKYIGEFKNGKFHGKGVLLTPIEEFDASSGFIKYEGEFKEGHYHGKGTIMKPSENGTSKFVGTFIDGTIGEGKCYQGKKEIDCAELSFN